MLAAPRGGGCARGGASGVHRNSKIDHRRLRRTGVRIVSPKSHVSPTTNRAAAPRSERQQTAKGAHRGGALRCGEAMTLPAYYAPARMLAGWPAHTITAVGGKRLDRGRPIQLRP